MTRTGTTRRRKRYSYYTCGGHHQKGETACQGRNIPTDKLDALVLAGLKGLLFTPERLDALLASLVQRQARNEQEVSQRLTGLQATAAEPEEKLKRLYLLVEGGAMQVDDLLRQRIQVLQAERAKLDSGDVNAKRAYIASVVSAIEVDDAIVRIVGQRDRFESQIRNETGNVPGFVRRWRTREDSNLWPLPSEGSALSS